MKPLSHRIAETHAELARLPDRYGEVYDALASINARHAELIARQAAELHEAYETAQLDPSAVEVVDDPPAAHGITLGDYAGWINSNESPNVEPLPLIEPGTIAEGLGTLWGVRWYNATGVLSDVEFRRIGDFDKGREGHAVYLNVYGDVSLRRVRAVGCGGQAVQACWRGDLMGFPPGEAWRRETRLPGWDEFGVPIRKASKLVLDECEAINCGRIQVGAAPRASWPFALYQPAAFVTLRAPRVRTEHPEGLYATGFLVARPAQVQRRCDTLRVAECDVEVLSSDRELIRAGNWRRVEIVGGRMTSAMPLKANGNATAIENDVDELLLEGLDWSGTVRIHRAAEPYGSPIREIEYVKGTRLEIEPRAIV